MQAQETAQENIENHPILMTRLLIIRGSNPRRQIQRKLTNNAKTSNLMAGTSVSRFHGLSRNACHIRLPQQNENLTRCRFFNSSTSIRSNAMSSSRRRNEEKPIAVMLRHEQNYYSTEFSPSALSTLTEWIWKQVKIPKGVLTLVVHVQYIGG